MRIRSIKPEFFSSPSTANCSPWARLLYVAMWCMADDWGVGSANPKELAAAAFPNDDQWTSKELPSLCKEVADNFGTLFYTHRGRPYFQIPTWDEHQVTQRRAKRRYPTADDPESAPDLQVCSFPSVRKEVPCEDKEIASTEQGNRGTGEQGNRGTETPPLAALAPPLAGSDNATPKPKPAAPKGTRLPDGWQPTAALAEQMRAECPGVDLHAEHRVFVDHWRAQSGQRGVKADWPATWRNWMRRAAKDQRGSRRRAGPDWDAALQRAHARDQAEGIAP